MFAELRARFLGRGGGSDAAPRSADGWSASGEAFSTEHPSPGQSAKSGAGAATALGAGAADSIGRITRRLRPVGPTVTET